VYVYVLTLPFLGWWIMLRIRATCDMPSRPIASHSSPTYRFNQYDQSTPMHKSEPNPNPDLDLDLDPNADPDPDPEPYANPMRNL
jgi:hypothetical protein